MPLWGTTDVSANSVKWAPVMVHLTANSTNQAALYNNTTVGAWTNGGNRLMIAEGQFGVSASEIQNARANSATAQPQHAGWVTRTVFTGPVVKINVVGGGTGYNNTDVVYVLSATGTVGTVNASAVPTTNSTGGLVSIAITNQGQGFANSWRKQ